MADTVTTALHGWPFPDMPGVPLHAGREGFHWLRPRPEAAARAPHIGDNTTPHPQLWGVEEQGWIVSGQVWGPERMARTETYVRPCPWPKGPADAE